MIDSPATDPAKPLTVAEQEVLVPAVNEDGLQVIAVVVAWRTLRLVLPELVPWKESPP